MENNLVMAIALSRLPPDEMSMDGRDQLRGKSTFPVVYKHIWKSSHTQENTRKQQQDNYWVKVCTKCPKGTLFLRKLNDLMRKKQKL